MLFHKPNNLNLPTSFLCVTLSLFHAANILEIDIAVSAVSLFVDERRGHCDIRFTSMLTYHLARQVVGTRLPVALSA